MSVSVCVLVCACLSVCVHTCLCVCVRHGPFLVVSRWRMSELSSSLRFRPRAPSTFSPPPSRVISPLLFFSFRFFVLGCVCVSLPLLPSDSIWALWLLRGLLALPRPSSKLSGPPSPRDHWLTLPHTRFDFTIFKAKKHTHKKKERPVCMASNAQQQRRLSLKHWWLSFRTHTNAHTHSACLSRVAQRGAQSLLCAVCGQNRVCVCL